MNIFFTCVWLVLGGKEAGEGLRKHLQITKAQALPLRNSDLNLTGLGRDPSISMFFKVSQMIWICQSWKLLLWFYWCLFLGAGFFSLSTKPVLLVFLQSGSYSMEYISQRFSERDGHEFMWTNDQIPWMSSQSFQTKTSFLTFCIFQWNTYCEWYRKIFVQNSAPPFTVSICSSYSTFQL